MPSLAPFLVGIAVIAGMLLLPRTVSAQYMYLDTDGDGINTPADRMNHNGLPTTVDVYLDPDHNRDGSVATCGTFDGDLTGMYGYYVNLRVVGGTVGFTSPVNQVTSFTNETLPFVASTTEMSLGYAEPPPQGPFTGPVLLLTVTVYGLSGTPRIDIVPDSNMLPLTPTSFITPCSGQNFDFLYTLGLDWSDVNGVQSIGLFGPKTDYFTGAGSRPRSVAIGDFNGDGRQDLATADSLANKVSVLLGNGDGTFGVKTDFTTGAQPTSVAIGDFDGDARRDLVVTNRGGNTVSVLLGNGDGTFDPNADFGTGSEPMSVVVADLNGNGVLDLAVANSGANTVSVLLGNGSGSFGTKADFATGTFPVSAAIGDVNGDGKPDLAVANRTSNTISVLLGDGLGSFSLASSPATGTAPSSVAIRGLNGGAAPDLVTTNFGAGTASVLLGNGNGTFGAKTDFGVGASPFSVATADLDGDGDFDLAVANSGSNTVSVLLGNGDGSFGAKTDFLAASRPEGVTLGDFSGDARPDLATACSFANTISVSLNQGLPGGPSLAPSVEAPLSLNCEGGGLASVSVTAADLDGPAIGSLTADFSALPAGNDAAFTANGSNTSGTLTWHPTTITSGSFDVVFTASNALSGSAATRIDVTPIGTSITGRLIWATGPSDLGTHDLVFRASDQFGDTASVVTQVTVTSGGLAPAAPGSTPGLEAPAKPTKGPVISVVGTTNVAAGTTVVLDTYVANADTLTADTTDLPADNTATFATDHEPDVAAPGTLSWDAGVPMSIMVTAEDQDGDAIVSLAAEHTLPAGNNAVFTVNETNTAGTLTWTPTLSDVGTFGVNFKATNALVGLAPTGITVGEHLSGNWRLNGNGADAARGATLTASAGVTYVAGQLGLAADLNGSVAARLQAPGTHDYDILPGGFTMECWVKTRSLLFAPDPTIARADSAGNAEAWELYVCRSGCPEGKVGVRVRHLGSPTNLVSNASINDALFHHVAVTYDGAALKLYIDGTLDNSLAAPGLQAIVGGGTIVLGDAPAGGSPFDGLLDNFRIWNTARTISQIQGGMSTELGLPTSVGGDGAPRYSFALGQNRPNPFNPRTTIHYELARAGRARLEIYNVHGRRIRRLVDAELGAGPHSISWDAQDGEGRDVASGVYFYRLETGAFISTRRMVLLR